MTLWMILAMCVVHKRQFTWQNSSLATGILFDVPLPIPLT